MRLLLLLPLYLLLSAAAPVHQLDAAGDDITAALFSPSPSPALSESPLPSVSVTPSADPSPTPATTSDASATPEPEPTASTHPSPTPSAAPSVSATVTPQPANELLPPLDDGFGDTDPEQGDALDANDDDDDDATEGNAFGFPPDAVTEEAAPKSVDGAAATAPSTISVLALVGVAVAILAPAVIIFWFVRRRSAGFQNIPRVDTDTYQGTSHGTFTVA